jgi:carboxyl-terminal processing protease
MDPRLRTTAIALATVIAALCAGMLLGGHPSWLPGGIRDIFVDGNIATHDQLIRDIDQSFWKPVKKSNLEQASFKGIVSSLHDRYSEYFTPAEAKAFTQTLNGQFEGVGMTVDSSSTKDGLRVRMVFPGSPAQKAGIAPGDAIVAVDGKTTIGQPADLSTGRIRGPAGTFVTLTVRPKGTGAPRTVKVERKKINLPLVSSRVVSRKGKKVVVVRLVQFSPGAHTQVLNAIDKGLKAGAKGVVFDLRGNPGGELTEGRDVASVFVPKGLIVSTRGRTQPEQKLYSTDHSIPLSIPVVVLVDHGTASAAEIAAGALRDHHRATIVGEKTYGKGVFQEVEGLVNGGLLKLTVGSYYLPNGENLAGDGIAPQVPAHDDPKTKPDEALPVALRTLQAQLK